MIPLSSLIAFVKLAQRKEKEQIIIKLDKNISFLLSHYDTGIDY